MADQRKQYRWNVCLVLVGVCLLLLSSVDGARPAPLGTADDELEGSGAGLAVAAKPTNLANDDELRDPSLSRGFTRSLFMILATEIGDETFIVAALMAMRYPKATVFGGAISALVVMTIISTALGYVVPSLISKRATGIGAGILYTFFGLRLLYIAYRLKPNETCEGEIEEVEEKLAEQEKRSTPSRTQRILKHVLSPVFLEAFILTFCAEWGDRSQIATIMLAAHQNPTGVTGGAIIGHCICTGAACLGGELLARRISPRLVGAIGGVLFLGFGAHQFLAPA